MTNFRALMLGTVAAGLALSTVATDAKADMKLASSGTDKTSLTIKGHVNRGIMIADDGADTDVFFVDNDTSQSRLTASGSGKVSEDLSVKAVLEVGFNMNDSSSAAQGTEDAATGNTIGVRHTYLSFDSKTYGSLVMGHTSDAADGAFSVDLSGTGISGAYADFPDVGGSLVFRSSGTQGVAVAGTDTETVSANWLSGDGTRTSLVRYDSPSFGGLQLHGSVAQGGWGIISGTYSGEFGGVKVAAAAGYSNAASSDALGVDSHWVGGVSALHESGISATFNFTVVDEVDGNSTANRDDPVTLYGKLGYQASLIDAGKSYFSISYGVGDDATANGDELEIIQFGFVQKIDATASELYLSVSHAEFDDAGTTNYEELVWGLAGARVKF